MEDAFSFSEATTDAEAMAAGTSQDLLDTPMAGSAALRGGALRLLGYGLGALLSVGSAAFLFRHLGVVDSGSYVLVLSLITIVQGLTDAGITAIGTREMSVRGGDDRDRLVANLLGLRLVLTAIGVLVAVGFAALARYDGVLIAGTALAGIGLIVQNTQSTLALSLTSGLRLGWLTAVDLMRQVVTVVLIITLVVAGAELLTFLSVPIPAALVALILTAVVVRGDIPMRPSFEVREWLILSREAMSFAAASAINVLYFRIAVVIVSVVASGTETGYFGTSFRIIEVLVAVPVVMVSAAFPIFARAARDDHERLAYALQRTFDAAAIVGTLVALALAVGAPFAIDVVAGPEFAPAKEILRIQALSFVGSFPAMAFGFALLSLRRHRDLLVINLVALVVTAALVTALTLADGARGAAIATTLGEILLGIALGIALVRAAPHLRPSLRVLPRLTLAAAAGAAVVLVPGLGAMSLALLASGVFVVMLFALGGVPEELIVELRHLLHRRGVE